MPTADRLKTVQRKQLIYNVCTCTSVNSTEHLHVQYRTGRSRITSYVWLICRCSLTHCLPS